MQRISAHSLYISNPKRSLDFYVNKLGMKLFKSFIEDEIEFYQLKFNEDTKEAVLELIYDKSNKETIFPKDSSKLEGYWKMSISIKDVDIARNKLLEKDIEVSTAFQVPNVAYLCHFFDPDGYALELIQHEFEQNHIKEKENKNYTLGNKAIFSLITYRVKDINKSLDFYKNTLDMELFSKMKVHQRGFELYFLGYSQETLPNKDIEAIENRTWLWQRDFTMIELQYILDIKKDTDFTYDVSKSTGFKQIAISNSKLGLQKDPDGYTIENKE